MNRALAAVLLALGLLAACDSSQSGESVTDTQVDQAPGQEGTEPEVLDEDE